MCQTKSFLTQAPGQGAKRKKNKETMKLVCPLEGRVAHILCIPFQTQFTPNISCMPARQDRPAFGENRIP